MTPTLHIQLLGGFRLTADDAPIPTLDSPRLQALLAYLLLQRDVPHARAHLAFQLWPDTTEAQAHANLRTLLHRLRQALPHADRLLHVDAQTVQWRPDALCTLDVADFERALAQAYEAAQRGDQATVRAALEATAALYQGDLLPECYDDWMLLERERLRQLFLAGLERLIVVLEHAGEYAAAIGHAQGLLRHDPLHEAAYQHLMRLHARSGDRASVVRAYHTCVTVLARELSMEPSPATTEIYEQLRHMEAQSPPPATRPTSLGAGDRRNNLPIALSSFIGRTRELAEVRLLLATTRLLTLTGAGGCGKTRLALVVATAVVPEYPDGVWLVELAALTDRAQVVQAVAAALGVREEPQRPLTATLVDALRARTLLLLLDNCEHLLDSCAQLATTLLSACPRLRILATSREALGVAGETSWLVPSLSLPDPQHVHTRVELAAAEAVELFVERAAAALPTFRLTSENASDVVQICQRLDGIPLAIELAAARVKVLSTAQLAARLDDCFRLLSAGGRTAVPRQQSLRATIDWSYALLAEPERALFRRLSVFAGGWTLEAAEAVCAGACLAGDEVLEALAHLVDKSLVVVDLQAVGETRYRLQEVVRQYSWEKLREAGESETILRQHAQYYLALAEAAEPRLWASQQPGSLAQLEREHGNLRAALAWSQGPAGSAEAGLRLAGALAGFWWAQGYQSEGRAWLEGALARPASSAPSLARAIALRRAGWMAGIQADDGAARASYEESLELFRALGGRRASAAALAELGAIIWMQGDYVRAAALAEESLALCRELGDRYGSAYALTCVGSAVRDQGDYVRASALFAESLALWRELGDKGGLALALNGMGDAVRNQGDYGRAAALYQQALALAWEAGHMTASALVRSNLGRVAHAQGDEAQALALLEEGVTCLRDVGHKWGLAWALQHLSAVAYAQGDDVRATAVLREALVLQQQQGLKGLIAGSLERYAGIAARRGQPARAACLFAAAEALRVGLSAPLPPSERADYDRDVASACAQLDEATFAAAWAAGRAMTLEQAIAEAVTNGA